MIASRYRMFRNASNCCCRFLPPLYRNVLLEMIAHFQSERMDEQRALLPGLKRISLGNANNMSRPTNNNESGPGSTTPEDPVELGTPPDDAFLDMLMRCQVSVGILKKE